MIELLEEELILIELFRKKAADKRRDGELRQSERLLKERKDLHELKRRKDEEERKLEEAVLQAIADQVAAFQHHPDTTTRPRSML